MKKKILPKTKNKKINKPQLKKTSNKIKKNTKVVKPLKEKTKTILKKTPKIKITKRAKKEKNIFISSNSIKTSDLLLQTEQEIIEMIKFDVFKETKEPEEKILQQEALKEEKYVLPNKYKDNRLILLPRDPWWLYTYWDISDNKINEVIGLLNDQEKDGLKWILRVYDITGIENSLDINKANSFFDVDIFYESGNWYLNVNQPSRAWCLEIGLKTKFNKFYPILRSNTMKTPNYGVSNELDEEWMLPDEEFFKLLKCHGLDSLNGKSSLSWQQLLEKQISSQISSWVTSPVKKNEADNFFLEVWTEVVLYGRTKPDASLTVAGSKVPLKADGTFAIRYSLPLGNFDFKVIGVSNDKKFAITKIPGVNRYDKEDNESKVKVESTPQVKETL